MPEPLSVHGRCPRCSQVLTLPAGQLQALFRCARCQYRAAGSTLVEEARVSPPKASAAPLSRLDEDFDDQNTRVLVPGGEDDAASEVPLPAVLVEAGASLPPAAPLQRFDAASEDGDDQHTRLHLATDAFLPPAVTRPSVAPARPRASAPAGPRPAATASRRPPVRSATLLGLPAAPAPAPLERVVEDSDDQHTRLLLPNEQPPLRAAPPAPAARSSTPPPMAAPAPVAAADPDDAPLQRFDQASSDADDQQTRLNVPISYEDAEPAPALRPLVAPRPSAAPSALDVEGFPPHGAQRLGLAALQLSRALDEWLRERRSVLLVTLAALAAFIAPALDAAFGNPRRGATVIVANLVLFFLWILWLAWLGKLRNDQGVWDHRVAFSRFGTRFRLVLGDLGALGAAPPALRWRVVEHALAGVGLAGLGISAALTISQLVWGTPEKTAPLSVVYAASSLLVVASVYARRRVHQMPVPFGAPPDVTAPAVALFPAVVDLSLPLSPSVAGGGTLIHQILEALSEWQPQDYPNRDSYWAALERHLMRHLGWAHVEREHWLGEQRSDGVAQLIVNRGVVLEVVRGFDASIGERLATKMRALAKVWRGKPVLIVVFDASRAELMNGPGAAALEALHQAYPILTVRMPSARPELG